MTEKDLVYRATQRRLQNYQREIQGKVPVCFYG